jgi:large subunit ribosomal protein L25
MPVPNPTREQEREQMAEITLVAEPGRTTGSAASRRLRSLGRIPAVVYGHGVDGISVSVDGRELRHALSGESGLNQLLSLKVGSNTHLALARVIQRHPVRHTLLHVDFQIVRRDEVISAEVPINFVGEAKAVEQERGVVEQPLTFLTVHATPARIPSHIEVDISGLTVGESIRVGDLTLPQGVTTDVPPDEPVVVASVSRAAIEAEAEEAAQAAQAEGAGGESGASADRGEGAVPDGRAASQGGQTGGEG